MMKLKNRNTPLPPPSSERGGYASVRSSCTSIREINDFAGLLARQQLDHTTKATLAGRDDNLRSVPVQQYQVAMPLCSVLLTMATTVALSFVLGCLARDALLNDKLSHGILESFYPQQVTLPRLTMIPNKKVPHTIYTSKNYDTTRTISSDILLDHPLHLLQGNDVMLDVEKRKNSPLTFLDEDGHEEDEDYEPNGQHLLVDMEGLDGAFLNSEGHLAQAMVGLVQSRGLTMLSYHCHTLLPAGVSCAGVLLGGHVSFHTRPFQGVIMLDLFSSGSNSLLPILDDVQRLFGQAPLPDSLTPHVVWSYKCRGFKFDEGFNPAISDLYADSLGVSLYERKEMVAHIQNELREVHIFDVLDPLRTSYSRDHDGPTEPSWDCRVYLDGVLRSWRFGEAAYHEALVHPGMLVHPCPARVAIIGDGAGCALREVLKHATVQEFFMIEIHATVVDPSRAWLQEWSGCSDLEIKPSAKNCYDDPRVSVYFDDATQWFKERYGLNRSVEALVPLFDVIIMNALNSKAEVNFSTFSSNDNQWPQIIHNALTPDHGVLAVRLGEARSLDDAADCDTQYQHSGSFLANLGEVDFHTRKI